MRAINKPPICCGGEPAKWNYLGPNLKFYVCQTCKQEVSTTDVHFLGKDACRVSPRSKAEHYWKDIDSYRRREDCNCKMLKGEGK